MTDRQKWYNGTYLQSDHWKDTRSKKLKKNPVCEICGSNYKLAVHHKNYNRLGNEHITDLMTVCYMCHKNIHGIDDNEKQIKSKEVKSGDKIICEPILEFVCEKRLGIDYESFTIKESV